MSDTIIVATISAVVSLVVSLLATSLKNKADLLRVQKEQEHGYAKALFDKRVECYPQLFNYLSDYAKVIRSNRQNSDNLARFKSDVDEWNSKHSLFFTKSTAKFSAKFRFLLGAILNNNLASEFSNKDWERLRMLIEYFEDFLKAEIGIFVAKPVGDVEGYAEAYKSIDEMIEESM
ncbi:MAG TPA: hypothetical protein VE732_05700, partial [Nitrososphaera sp.]|nr:hypothetical protein [Nitrososphaera sp.]